METALLPSGSQSPESGEWDSVEKSMVEMVKKKRMKVERLERELDVFKKHLTRVFESFSVPTFPEGYDPVTEHLGDEYLNGSVPSSQAAARGLKWRQSPSSRIRNEAEFADEGDLIRNRTPSKQTLLSSKSASTSMEARDVMDFTTDNEIDLMKDEIRRVRSGGRSPKKSPAKQPNGISPRVPEKETLKTGPGSNDDSESSSEEESSSESSEEEPPNESSDEEPPNEPSDDEESSGNEGSESTSEDSDDESDEAEPDPPIESRKTKPSGFYSKGMSAQGTSSSSASDSVTEKKSSPVKTKRISSGEKAKTTWQPKTKAPSSSSEDSGEESSSSSDEDTGKNRSHAQTGRASFGRARELKAPESVSPTSLSSDASPEDLFDWIILGFQGPWMPPVAAAEVSSGASELNDQSLPLKFPSVAAYTATFQKLIEEEAKANLVSEWEQFEKEQDSNTEQQSLNVDSRGISSVWRLRSMVTGEAFHYFEADSKQGNFINFDTGEFLCMVVPGTVEVKAVAVVHHQDRLQAPLLKTRVPWDFSLDECVLLRLCNIVPLRRMFLAVATLSEIFSPLQQQILDPLANSKSVKSPPVGGDPKPKLSLESLRNFSDRKILNTLQLLAVSSLLDMHQGFQLVQGPPGTGKTSTIVGMVSTLLIEEPGVRILVCAPSNAALDEVAARLMHGMLDKSGNIYSPIDGSVVRSGEKKKMHPIVQAISLDSLTLRLLSSSNRSRGRVDVLDGASVVCATLSGCGHYTFDEMERMFDVVIIDEAAQAVEAEVLIALKRVRGRCVMVGDPQQLPATVKQRPSVAYGRSLFERFQEGGNPVHMLTTQYRMHPSICIYPSNQFYNGALTNSSRTSTMQSIFTEDVCARGITIRGCRFKLGHYCFMDVGWGTEHEELVGHSRANFEEALVVCNIVEGAVKGLLPGRKPNVGVITPYIAQRGVIEGELEKRGIECEVNTVDGFQGREKDVIVLSCVRAMADRGLGFVSDERRMNVALTRARYSIIIVGHAMTLRKWSNAWDSLIEDARKRGCYQVLQNKKNHQDVPASNWNRSPLLRKDLNGGTVEVENIPPASRKRSLNSTEGGRPNKKEYSKPFTTDAKSNKNVKDKEDSAEAQTLSRNFKMAGVEEKAVCKTKVKRKREEAFETEGGKRYSQGLEKAPNAVSAEKLKSRQEVNVAANSPDLSAPPKKKKKKQAKQRFSKSQFLRKEKVKVESGAAAEPSATKRSPVLQPRKVKVELEVASPISLKAVKQEFPTVEKRTMNTVICLPAPALASASKRKGTIQATLPNFPTEKNVTVGAAPVKEVIVDQVKPSSVPGCSRTGRNTSLDNRKIQTPAGPIPQGTNNWRSAGTERRSRAWFPNSVSENDRHSPHMRPPLVRSVHSGLPASSSAQGFANFDVDTRQPHWGNSYGAATGPQNVFRGHEVDISNDNMYFVLTRPNNYSGMQSNNRGNLQQVPWNHWPHPNTQQAAAAAPHGHQFSGRQFS